MSRILAFLLGLLSLMSCASAQTYSVRTIDASEFAEIIKFDSVTFVDVRTADEYVAGHIEHAGNMDVLKADFKYGQGSCPKTRRSMFIAVPASAAMWRPTLWPSWDTRSSTSVADGWSG
jgi:hypothetical protein